MAALAAVAALALPVRGALDYSVAVDVWTDRGEDFFYLPGDPVRVYFRPVEDCYLVVYQIDTEGNVFLLFPASYGRAFFARAGITYCVNDLLPDLDLQVFGPSGVGYIGVLASPVPFRVPRWLRPHPAFHGWLTVYSTWYYPRVVVEPYLAICQINARIVEDWGWGLRFGIGYCWFYVERCYVPVYPIWHRRYWEVRVVTRPVYDRLWAHHDRFYRVPPRRHAHHGEAPGGAQPEVPRPFERRREFRASPAPEPPAWVREVSNRSMPERSVDREPAREGSRQRIARLSAEETAEPGAQAGWPRDSRRVKRTPPEAAHRGDGLSSGSSGVPHRSDYASWGNSDQREARRVTHGTVTTPTPERPRQREARRDSPRSEGTLRPAPTPSPRQDALPWVKKDASRAAVSNAPSDYGRKPVGGTKGDDGPSRPAARARIPRS